MIWLCVAPNNWAQILCLQSYPVTELAILGKFFLFACSHCLFWLPPCCLLTFQLQICFYLCLSQPVYQELRLEPLYTPLSPALTHHTVNAPSVETLEVSQSQEVFFWEEISTQVHCCQLYSLSNFIRSIYFFIYLFGGSCYPPASIKCLNSIKTFLPFRLQSLSKTDGPINNTSQATRSAIPGTHLSSCLS